MAGTATRRLAHATIADFEVEAAGITTLGFPVSFSATAGEIVNTAAGADDAIGVSRVDVAALDTARRAQVTLYGPVEVVVVGTGGASEGSKAVFVADGFTDAPAHDSSGATDDQIQGIFMQDGAAGERVGMMMITGNRGSA